MTSVEPAASRWSRRARTIPAMLGATTLGVAASPLLIVAAAAFDLAHGRRRLPRVRMLLFALQYGINDCVEIVLAPLLWIVAGLGTRLHSPASIARHERLQRWSIRLLARRAERLLGLRLVVDDAALAALAPGPAIVLCRHVSLMDASLPTLLLDRLGMRSRGVIMAELLADPGFDLIYARTGSVFIPRDDPATALQQIATLARDVDASTAIVIFPEGRLFRPDRLERALARLSAEDPDRARRLAGITSVLLPRPAGTLALLDAVPTADVVVVGHAGLDRFGRFADLVTAVPLTTPITVTAWRTPASEIPATAPAREAWLDEQWCRLDRWVAACEART